MEKWRVTVFITFLCYFGIAMCVLALLSILLFYLDSPKSVWWRFREALVSVLLYALAASVVGALVAVIIILSRVAGD